MGIAMTSLAEAIEQVREMERQEMALIDALLVTYAQDLHLAGHDALAKDVETQVVEDLMAYGLGHHAPEISEYDRELAFA